MPFTSRLFVPGRATRCFVPCCAALILTACASVTPTRAKVLAPASSTPPRTATTPVPARASSVGNTSANAIPAIAAPANAADALGQRIDAFVAQSRFAGASWGIDVVSLDTGLTVYAYQPNKLAIPASNAKLYTATLALHDLGPRQRIRTSLFATAKPRANGVLVGDLILVGRGDPNLGSGNDSTSPQAWADTLAQALATRGVHRVRGDLIADDTWFGGTPIGAGWEAGDLQSWFAPPASALSVQGNLFVLRVDRHGKQCCDVGTQPDVPGLVIRNLTGVTTTGPTQRIDIYRAPGANVVQVFGKLPSRMRTRHFRLSAPDPALLAGGLLRDALVRHGITLTGQVRALHWPRVDTALQGAAVQHMADLYSPSVADLVQHTLKHSDNLYAQLLLLQAGAKRATQGTCTDRPRAPDTTVGWGLCAMRALLRQIGIANDAVLEEGSGLSRKDLVTPAATTRLLSWIARQPFADALIDALPVAGVDGTLHHRLRGTPAAGNLRAKTGTLSYSYTLSGYVTAANGEHLVFSLMLDKYQRPRDAMGRAVAPSPNQDIDAIAAMLAGYGETSPPLTP